MKKLLLTLALLCALPFAASATGTAEDLQAAAVNASAALVEIEAQDWWTQNGDPAPGRHIHTTVHFPLHQVVSGTFTLPVDVALHGNPGRVGFVRIQLFDKYTKVVNVSGWQCATDCTFHVDIPINTSGLADAKWEARVTANIAASDATFGKRMYTTSRYHLFTENGNGGSNDKSQPVYRSPGVAGWYEGPGYTNVYCGSGIVSGAESGFDLLTQTQTGVVSTACRWDGSGRYMATVNPNFHAGNPGKVLLSGSGATSKKITIDTTQLPAGRNNLVVLSCTKVSSGESCGVIKMPFQVSN